MAEAQGKLSGRPGICFVTRGPGATNASIGLHTAFQDSHADDPVRRPGRERPARSRGVPGSRLPPDVRPRHARLREVGRRDPRPDRLPEYVARAFHTAMQGRPGPVVLALPEDMLTTPTSAPALAARRAGARLARARRAARRAHDAAAKRSGRSSSPAAAAGTPKPARRCSASPRTGTCRSAAHSASRTPSTTAIRYYAGDVGIGINPKLAAAHQAKPTSSSRSARASAR